MIGGTGISQLGFRGRLFFLEGARRAGFRVRRRLLYAGRRLLAARARLDVVPGQPGGAVRARSFETSCTPTTPRDTTLAERILENLRDLPATGGHLRRIRSELLELDLLPTRLALQADVAEAPAARRCSDPEPIRSATGEPVPQSASSFYRRTRTHSSPAPARDRPHRGLRPRCRATSSRRASTAKDAGPAPASSRARIER